MSDNAMNTPTRTDWSRLAQQTDDDIDTSDIPILTDEFFGRAKLLIPREMIDRTIQIDADVMKWLRSHEQHATQTINHILRAYIESQKV
ncbi:hypothetical protein [Candidatus Oscillochloris fontis]|uniref:hypothetical protein n=1 Tax=Candidatus Oscillochloris fontis TaxID=2496868 RepID=UPI00101B6C9C|nr:hypothetical protein [Candidatus Oscillochloris fontis]